MRDCAELVEHYRQLLAIGEEMLDLLRGETCMAGIDQVIGLIERRGPVVTAAITDVEENGMPEGARPVLEQVILQQHLIDERLRSALADLRRDQAAVQSTRSGLTDVHRLLHPSALSHSLNTVR